MKTIAGIVDISDKKKTKRMARAQTSILLNKEIIKKIKQNKIPKGNIFDIARVAAIMAVKETHALIPHCHIIPIEHANIEFQIKKETVIIESLIKTTSKTGVEMEAMVACSIAALTIYDICKAFSKEIAIQETVLIEKRGGKSGVFRRKGK